MTGWRHCSDYSEPIALVVDDNIYARAISEASLKKLGISDIVEAD